VLQQAFAQAQGDLPMTDHQVGERGLVAFSGALDEASGDVIGAAGHCSDQIDDYLAPPSDERYLVHADLHGDHIFIRDGHLAGIIDWGDALCGDPYYDLPALFFGTFGASKPLLRTFLDAYGWPVGSDFVHRAMR
jgi:hypothetical protein